MSKCIGCGAVLQSTDKTKAGYIPASVEAENGAYCKKCHAIRHYNLDYSDENLALVLDKENIRKKHEDYYNLIQNIKNEQALVLLMIDALDIYTNFIPKLSNMIGNNPVWILVNKSDLYPKDLKLNQMKEKIKENARLNNLSCDNIFFISSLKEKNVDMIMDRMFQNLNKKHYPSKYIYILGSTSVGKSTFVNLVLKKYAKTVDVITTSMQANTTNNLIKIGVGKNRQKEECFLIDTPGYFNNLNILSCAPLKSLKLLVPSNYLKVKTYQLFENQLLLLGGLVTLDIETTKASISCYVSDKLYIHRAKPENKERVMKNLKFKELVPPFDEVELGLYGKEVETNVSFEEEVNIWLAGVGILHITGSGKIKVTAPEMIHVTVDHERFS